MPEMVNKDELAEGRYWKVLGAKEAVVVRAKTEAEAQEIARTSHFDQFRMGVTKVEEINEMTYTLAKLTELESSVRHINERSSFALCFIAILTFIIIFMAFRIFS